MKTFPIQIVGAGPGDPELITVKGMRALKKADVVVYTGSLVPETLLELGAPIGVFSQQRPDGFRRNHRYHGIRF